MSHVFLSLPAAIGLCVGLAATARAGALDKAIEQTLLGNVASARSQAKVADLSDERAELLSRYRALVEQNESLKVYEAQLNDLVAFQESEVSSLRDQIDRATNIAREMTPLMLRMVEGLEAFINLDVPFLRQERQQRIARLREVMDRADVTTSEKFRRLLEAYQIENEYGRTIEAYQDAVGEGDGRRTMNFLRVGRVALIYQSLDEQDAAVWDQEARVWKPLHSSYRGAIKKGLRIARRQMAPDLIRIPVPAPSDTASPANAEVQP